MGELVQETLPCHTCMDDLAILLEPDSYLALLALLAPVKEGTVRIASDFGLQIKLAPGKTEVVVSWFGRRSRPVRRRLMSLSDKRHAAMLPLKTRLGDDGELQNLALSANERASADRSGLSPSGDSPLKLGLAWAERSHRVLTPDRRPRMRCRVDS